MKKKHVIRKGAAAILVLCMTALAGCSVLGPGAASSQPSSVQSSEPVDINYPLDFDNVYIEAKPQRVVSLSPSLTEIFCELGFESRLVGRTDYCDTPESVNSLPTVGTPMMLDTKKIAELAPDLIVMQAPPTNEAMIKLQQTGAAIVTIARAYDVASTGELYAKICRLMEGAEAGVELGEQYKARFIARLDRLTKSIEAYVATKEDAQAHTAAYLIDTVSIAATPDTYPGKLLAVLGLDNVASGGVNWQFPAEKTAEAKPYVLLLGSDVDLEALKKSKTLGGLSAVKNDRLYTVNNIVFERQSLRVAEELERISQELYPGITLEQEPSSQPVTGQSPTDASSGAG